MWRKVADDTNLGGVGNTSKVREITQMAQRRLGTWRESNKSWKGLDTHIWWKLIWNTDINGWEDYGNLKAKRKIISWVDIRKSSHGWEQGERFQWQHNPILAGARETYITTCDNPAHKLYHIWDMIMLCILFSRGSRVLPKKMEKVFKECSH